VSIRVLRPGLLTTMQDNGRHGLQHVGLCPGGAMDPVALALANALVGNEVGEAALEITVIARAGTRFNVGRAVRGARAYLAAAGGFAVEPVLGSRSTYLPGRFGGFEGRALKHGDELPLRDPGAAARFASLKRTHEGTVKWSAPPHTLPDREPILVHVLEGQHFTSFDTNAQRAFFDTVWKIAPESNRMGFRLAGPALVRSEQSEILSGPTTLGSIQVPANGTPIALMADHQTTGGYPRIAEIASADVPRLAQLAPGGSVHFARCDLGMAAELRHHGKERLAAALRGIGWSYGQ
jgi:antagonist of KipI